MQVESLESSRESELHWQSEGQIREIKLMEGVSTRRRDGPHKQIGCEQQENTIGKIRN